MLETVVKLRRALDDLLELSYLFIEMRLDYIRNDLEEVEGNDLEVVISPGQYLALGFPKGIYKKLGLLEDQRVQVVP